MSGARPPAETKTKPLAGRALLLALALAVGAQPGLAQRMGACVHAYRSGVVSITGASSSSTTGEPITQLTLSNFKVDGQPVAISEVQVFNGAVVAPQGISCTLPCSLGTQVGRWQFTATAPGHQPAPVDVAAQYAEFAGGCPSYNDRGTEVRPLLTPSAS